MSVFDIKTGQKDPAINLQVAVYWELEIYLRKAEEERLMKKIHLRDIARKAEEERRLIEAIELEKEGDTLGADEIINEPILIITPTVKMDIPKMDGRLYRTTWKWKITDKTKIPREYLTTDDIKINGVVRALKGDTNINGIQVYEE